MAPFDAELYLRLIGERGLLNTAPRQRSYDQELFEIARLLVAIGAIDLAEATDVVDGYERAQGLRNGHGPRRWQRQPSQKPTTAPEERRTVICDTTVEHSSDEIRIRSVTLSASVTKLNVRVRRSTGVAASRMRRMPMSAMLSYNVADDRGTKSTTDFTGGGRDQEWRGTLTTKQPLAVDTAWIELEGIRIELADKSNPCTVAVETLPDADPAIRYLWHWLAAGQRHGPQIAIEPLLDALILGGHLGADDPALAVIRHAAEAANPRMPRGQGGPSPGPVDHAPPEWRSFLGPRPARRTARGAVALVGVAPPFDEITVTVDELYADEQGWQIEVDIGPGLVHGPFGGSLEAPQIAWWAVDDRGQYYLGHLGSFSGGPDGTTGTVEFGPGLDRAAKTLTLLPTGPTERARIEIPLQWSER
jgi:hypothetical protein